MAPTAVYSNSPIMTLEKEKLSLVADLPAPMLNGPVLAIGSLATAQDGQYQSIVSSLDQENAKSVEKQMLDRLVDGATSLAPSTYAAVHVVLSPADYERLMPSIAPVLSQLLAGLTPLGTLHLLNLTAGLLSLPTELALAGFTVLSSLPETGIIVAQKPAPAAPSAALPLRKKADPARKNTKKALWALSAPAPGTPSIDPEALLTASDRARPAVCEPVTAGGAPRRKKACKNCTCGLAEVEAEEERTGRVVLLDGESAVEVGADADEQERLRAAAASAPKATSSCGNCFLGDAFRCASCPYLGLPAFKPGEKVEIDLGMDDDI